ncbi:chemotaxis protein MotB [Planomonospora parontospora subsp. parontospora]|uniref:Chemotaxis protein MotB n=2 Tax=Planomonospora parontospora TaxID=58119 RepID=A0AA37BPJ2_9ACTN|nr:flagellar motor protein MotB [Planomonospora parontospora]GGK96408.1 chemotaxis protein MotB [Planomonospora parontospora]GII12757.1 chemotaxis protein MotB [Planomonospora parontospora subsp. parontospora]
MSTKPHRRKKHGGGHEEEAHADERWLVTYGDMLTVLMALFIVLFAMSQVDQNKFNALKSSLSMAFGQPAVTFTAPGSAVTGDAGGGQSAPMEFSSVLGKGADGEAEKKARDALAALDRARASARAKNASAEVEKFERIKKKIQEALRKQNAADSVQFRIDERGLVVTVVTSSVVFGNNSAELLRDGRKIIDSVAPALRAEKNSVEVDGHTNWLPVSSGPYPSNWELSTARASTVVRRLVSRGIPAKRLNASGYADQRPLYPDTDPRSVSLNRRVEVVVLSDLDAATKALLPSAAGQSSTS